MCTSAVFRGFQKIFKIAKIFVTLVKLLSHTNLKQNNFCVEIIPLTWKYVNWKKRAVVWLWFCWQLNNLKEYLLGGIPIYWNIGQFDKQYVTFGRQDLDFSASKMMMQWTYASPSISSIWMENRYSIYLFISWKSFEG